MSPDETIPNTPQGEDSSLPDLTLESFEPHVDSIFAMLFDDGSDIDLRLVEATRLEGIPAVERPPFSLIFRGPQSPCLNQGSFHLRHETLGPLLLFLVPVQSDGDGTDYEAVFT